MSNFLDIFKKNCHAHFSGEILAGSQGWGASQAISRWPQRQHFKHGKLPFG